MQGPRTQRRVNNVASDTTTFVGRSHELREIRNVLALTRLLTLTGAGGVGKTRLAKAAIAGLYRSFRDGARFVDLSQAFDDEVIVQLIRDATPGVRDAGTLVAQLSCAELLLVLDNCEHLVERVSSIASQVLAWCPTVKIITTTRLPLGITGEHIIRVAPLGVEATGVGKASESASLFIDRARAVTGREFGVRDLTAVNELCVRLEGLPLAIELAAIKARIMAVPEISTGLDDRFELLTGGPRDAPVRHRSLDALLRWSWDNCSPDERSLWTQFSVFAGSVSMDAVTSICDLGGPANTTRAVDGLVQQSLLVVDDTQRGVRFRMLDTIREFGRKAMLAHGDGDSALTSVRLRHLHYYKDFVSTLSAEWFGSTQQESSQLAAANISNIRVAFEYSLENSELCVGADSLFSGLWLFWVSARLAEGRAWAERLYRQFQRLNNAPSSASLWTCGWISLLSGDLPGARAMLAEASVRASTQEDFRGICLSKGLLAACAAIDADLDFAAEQYDEIVETAKSGGDPVSLGILLQNRAEVRCLRGDYRGAHADCVLAEMICTEHGDEWLLLYVLWVRTLIAYRLGDLIAARRDAIRALRLSTSTENQHGVALVAETLAWTISRQGDGNIAAVLLGATERYWAATGCTLMGVKALIDFRTQCMATLAEDIGSEQLQHRLAQGATQDVTALQRMADAIEGVSTVTELGAAQELDIRGVVGSPKESTALSKLTDRQYEIALLVARGMTNKEISAALVIGRRTVDTHVGHILARLGVARRSEIATLVGSARDVGPSRSTAAGN